MTEPIPPAETVEDAMRHASEQLRALKKTKPQNAAEARLHSAELVRLQQELISATHRATDAAAAKRLNGSNGHAKPVEGEATSLSDGVITALAEAIVPFIKELIADAVAEPIARLAEIEKRRGLAPLASRLAQLEQDALKYEGTWREGKTYAPGACVTFQGSLWVCEGGNGGERPGAGATSWRLAVKRGRAEK
jgi:formate dehydrogenase maturation protein FdhE